MTDSTLYPWQTNVWRQLSEMRQRMPHALLLQGKRGIGKMDFSLHLARSLLCDRPEQDLQPCGGCESCKWFEQDNHPDFRLIEPGEVEAGVEDESPSSAKPARKNQISVDKVRELGEFLNLSSHRAGLRIVLLHPAEGLNLASANALLKMLEEPPAGVLFLLVTHQPQRLLPTIRSRCNIIGMPVPMRLDAEAWLTTQGVQNAMQRLAYAGGSPLQALQDQVAELRASDLVGHLGQGRRMDPFAAAGFAVKLGVVEVVTLMQKWLYDLYALSLTGQLRYHLNERESLQALAKGVDLHRLLEFQRVLDEARRHALHPLNADLQLESLMIQYSQVFTVSS